MTTTLHEMFENPLLGNLQIRQELARMNANVKAFPHSYETIIGNFYYSRTNRDLDNFSIKHNPATFVDFKSKRELSFEAAAEKSPALCKTVTGFANITTRLPDDWYAPNNKTAQPKDIVNTGTEIVWADDGGCIDYEGNPLFVRDYVNLFDLDGIPD